MQPSFAHAASALRSRGWRCLKAAALPEAWRAVIEDERPRWILWLPVALAVGIVGFFALPGEPPAWCGRLALILALVLAAAARRRRGTPVSVGEALLLGLAAAALGFALAQARLHAVAAPRLDRASSHLVEGRIVDIAPRPGGSRLLLDRLTLSKLAPEATPATIRVNLRGAAADLAPGDRVRLRARLQPPMPPALPGGFDFARQAWFERLGAVGFALGRAERLPGPADEGRLLVAGLRARIAQRIAEVNPGPAGAVAAALIAGVRAGIDQETWRTMQVSGLAHLISVSGLHMALVAGGVFTACYSLLALLPALALRFPVKKIAALVAIAAGAGYLALSGASVPTQRAFLMAAAALLAVLVDRNPFSIRLLAWSATLVLVLRPEAVIGASFQLSFAAVLALIAAHEAWRRRRRDDEAPRSGGALAVPGRYLAGVCLTTLVASLATTPLGAFHFQTIPTYGMLANLIAVPLTSFIVMPAGLVGLLLLPFGLDGPAFRLMGLGVEGVLMTANTAAALPGASILVHQWPAAALILFAGGGLWLALWLGTWRWLGLLPAALAVILALASRPPDLLVDPGLGMAAARRPDGGVTLITWRRDRLVQETWLRHLGVAEADPAPRPGQGPAGGVACDHAGCVVQLGERRVSLAHEAEAVFEDCGRVDLVVARLGPEACRREDSRSDDGRLIGPRRLWSSGGLAITATGRGLVVRTVADARGDWPWTRRQPRSITRKLRN